MDHRCTAAIVRMVPNRVRIDLPDSTNFTRRGKSSTERITVPACIKSNASLTRQHPYHADHLVNVNLTGQTAPHNLAVASDP
jgi:hypothetical protein